MKWTELEEDVLRQCRECIETCKRYASQPAPWFPLLLEMFQELKDAGRIERVEVDLSVCDGCLNRVGGSCRHHYPAYAARLDRERMELRCTNRRTAEEKEARERQRRERERQRAALWGGESARLTRREKLLGVTIILLFVLAHVLADWIMPPAAGVW